MNLEKVQDRRFVESLLQAYPDLYFVLDKDGVFQFTAAGSEGQREFYVSPKEFIGKTIRDLVPKEVADGFIAAFERVRHGEERVSYEYGLNIPAMGLQYYEARIVPFQDGGFLLVARNITARRRAEQRERFLSDAGKILASSIDYHATLRSLLHIVVPLVADYCVLRIAGEDEGNDRIELACEDPEKERILREMAVRYLWSRSIDTSGMQAIHARKAVLHQHIDEDYYRSISHDEGQFSLIQRLRPVSSLAVPLISEERILGSLTLGRFSKESPFDMEDLTLMEEVGRRASIAMEHSHLLRQEREASRKLNEFVVACHRDLVGPLGSLEKEIGNLRALAASVEDRKTGTVLSSSARAIQRSWEEIQSIRSELSQIQPVDESARRAPEEVQPVRVDHVVRAALDYWSPLMRRKSIQLSLRSKSLVDPVLCQKLTLQNSLQEWLGGALKAAPEGATLSFSLEQEGDDVSLTITLPGPVEDGVDLAKLREVASTCRATFRTTHGGAKAAASFTLVFKAFRPS